MCVPALCDAGDDLVKLLSVSFQVAWIAQSLSFHIFWERSVFMGDKVSVLPDLVALRFYLWISTGCSLLSEAAQLQT